MPIQCRLSADRQHVLDGLKLLARQRRKVKPHERAQIGFDGVCLTVDWADMRFFARASGIWPGTAVVNAALVHALAAAPPPGDPLVVTCDGTDVRFGPVRIACKWEPISERVIAPAAGIPEWMEAIALKHTLPRARIDAEGRLGEVEAAERRLQLVIRRVARTLGPLGVTDRDIEALVERRLAERYGPRDDAVA